MVSGEKLTSFRVTCENYAYPLSQLWHSSSYNRSSPSVSMSLKLVVRLFDDFHNPFRSNVGMPFKGFISVPADFAYCLVCSAQSRNFLLIGLKIRVG